MNHLALIVENPGKKSILLVKKPESVITNANHTSKWHLPGFKVDLNCQQIAENILDVIDELVSKNLELTPPLIASLIDDLPKLVKSMQPLDFESKNGLNEKIHIYWQVAHIKLFWEGEQTRENGLVQKWFPREDVYRTIPKELSEKYPRLVTRYLKGIILDANNPIEGEAWT